VSAVLDPARRGGVHRRGADDGNGGVEAGHERDAEGRDEEDGLDEARAEEEGDQRGDEERGGERHLGDGRADVRVEGLGPLLDVGGVDADEGVEEALVVVEGRHGWLGDEFVGAESGAGER
jgi:hypothetical protein